MKRLAPFGKRLAKNFSHLIVDKHNKIIKKKGTIGELIICGKNVGDGYYNNILETKEKFIQNPNHNKYKNIVYKSALKINGHWRPYFFILLSSIFIVFSLPVECAKTRL